VSHFESAGNSAYPGAEFYRALALLFGGREVEAKAVFSDSYPQEGVNTAYLEKIKKSLQPDPSTIFNEVDDEVKYFWVLLNISQPQQLVEELWESTHDQPRFHIALALANRAMDLREWDLALKWLENSKLPGTMPENLTSQLKWAWVRFYLHSGAFQDLAQSVNMLSDNSPNKRLLLRFVEARNLETEDNLEKAENLYLSVATANPYLAPIILEAARFFEDVKGDSEQAYELLLQAMEFNHNSLDLRMAYTLQCLNMGLTHYAELSLAVLAQRLGTAEFASFERVYKQKEVILLELEQKIWEGQEI
jgi:hypothetical protein